MMNEKRLAIARKNQNEVKVAIEMQDKMTTLMSIDQTKPLTECINRLCQVWDLPNSADDYALVFSDRLVYITEQNRNEIQQGQFLRLNHSVKKEVTDIFECLQSSTANDYDKCAAMNRLKNLSSYYRFAEEFISRGGFRYIVTCVQENTYSGVLLSSMLQAFVELMEHNLISWDSLEPLFIGKVANQVNSSDQDSRALQASLSILESVVTNSTSLYQLVEQEVPLPNLVIHIQSGSAENQQSAIALINALYYKAEASKRKSIQATLSSRQIRQVILVSILQKYHPIGSEMAHQLYVLQTVLFNSQEEKRRAKLNSQDPDTIEKLHELRKLAFDGETEQPGTMPPKKSMAFARDFKRLGFLNITNPLEELTEPPGMLALDNMLYFARHHTPTYAKIVLSNSSRADEHECPFARCSLRLTRHLSDILKIGEPPTEHGKTFLPMFFTHDHAFEEFFSTCIVLLNKTWKEMRATTEDFVKVFGVVQDQIVRSLFKEPLPSTFDKFKSNLDALPYSEIMNLWQQERCNRDEYETKALPIVQLRQQVTPELLRIIQEHRLNCLVAGAIFQKYSNKGHRIKDSFWCCRLSPNFKVFHYGDCDERATPTHDELSHKLPVVEIRSLLRGKDCPHMRDIKKAKSTATLAFSLIPEPEQEALNFVAPNEHVFNMWVDGICALLGERMLSENCKNDLDILLNMEIKIRLLDAEGVEIPDKVPPIPADPPDLCF